ncbi:MAG TPA: YdiU family protein [Candidatus Corynebacterium gallistercoris]|uniref:Protein nucleotidyltransferase YdiU n=1 Tax=Candidatus Corynebacterium gallistercoris TaxID=2838530 RepID=A0A9D1RZL9_9CORY|nr:YdiU family protein [Candidatus Corynebacterium gallistercoris]
MNTPTVYHQFASELPELTVPVTPRSWPDLQLRQLNDGLAMELGWDPEWLRSPSGIQFLTGHNLGPDAQSVAQAYAGHQFGQFNPHMGDGRAILLGEVSDPHAPEGVLLDLHLKGSGRTPFSKNGDGLYPLQPALKELLYSEALHHLGVPTSRVLAVFTTGQPVQRGRVQPGAVVLRVAASHVRIGTFQMAALLDIHQTKDESMPLTQRLAEFVRARHYPTVEPEDFAGLFEAIAARQAQLVAAWMRLGFIHGVMNTDNIAVSGQTLDFGPCAFMDFFNADTVYSSIDTHGRYAYGRQPSVMGWDLARLAETFVPLVCGGVAELTEIMNRFEDSYASAWRRAMSHALGSTEAEPKEFIEVLAAEQPDYGATLRALALTEDLATSPARDHLTSQAGRQWLERWWASQPDTASMRASNPAIIPRNHEVDRALSAAEGGDMALFEEYLAHVRDPYTDKPGSPLTHARQGAAGFTTYCGT